MKFTDMTIQKRFFLLLLSLSLLMGLGIIVPGYLKIRDFEWLEAKNYALDRSIRMREQIEKRVDILEKSGVAEIDAYVQVGREDLIRTFQALPDDPRVIRFVLDTRGRKIYDGGGEYSLPLKPTLLKRINASPVNYLRYEMPNENWMTTFQQYDDWGWTILSMMSEREVYRDSRQYLVYVMGVSGLVLLGVLFLYWLLTRRLRDRASSILEHLQLFRSGEYGERLQVTGPGELGILQKSINSMIDHIEMEILSRKSVEYELHAAKQQAEQINQAKAEYVADMSKQAYNSMNSVCGFSELLLKTELDERQQSYVGNVLTSSRKLTSLVSDILDMSGMETESEPEHELGGEVLDSMREVLQNLEVLLIGADHLNQEYISEILGVYNIHTVALSDESAGIKYLDENDADLVILDIDHSRLQKEESITYLRRNLSAYSSSIPIMVMVSKSSHQKVSRYHTLGVRACIAKPFNSSKLLNLIERMMVYDDE